MHESVKPVPGRFSVPVRVLCFATTVVLGAAGPSLATTYVMVDDRTLSDQAAAVVDGRVVAVEPAPTATRPATDYTVEVERILGGSVPGTTLVVRVPGGVRPDGVRLHLYGVPRFARGQRLILFLTPAERGRFGILHLALGAFHRVETGSGAVALRDLSEALVIEPPGRKGGARRGPARDYEAFASWLFLRSAGRAGAADYFVDEAFDRATVVAPKFTLFEHDGLNLRWFEFDSGTPVDWFSHVGGQPSVPEGGVEELQAALEAWSSESCTPVQLSYAGTTSASGGLESFDDTNVVLQDDPNDEISGSFECGSGGTLAIGGPWFSSTSTGTFQGEEYIRILGGDVVMNDGIECLEASSGCFPLVIEEIYGHEVGHTLGIAHACGDGSSPSCFDNPVLADALMRAFAHLDCRGAQLGTDDEEALWSLYDDGSACTGDLVLDLTSQTVDTVESFEACRSITAGSGFVVATSGDVAFQAGERIVLASGFSVEDGGSFSAGVDSALRCQ